MKWQNETKQNHDYKLNKVLGKKIGRKDQWLELNFILWILRFPYILVYLKFEEQHVVAFCSTRYSEKYILLEIKEYWVISAEATSLKHFEPKYVLKADMLTISELIHCS